MRAINKNNIAVFFVIGILMLSFSSQQPTGRTGAPGDGLCTDCHANNGSFGADITLSGIPSNPDPNTTYDVTIDVDVTSGSPVRSGFSMVSLDNSNDEQAGDWSNPGSGSNLRNANDREYFGHNPAQNFSGGNVSWEAEWTAPNLTDDVTFYIAVNLANGSGTAGERILVM